MRKRVAKLLKKVGQLSNDDREELLRGLRAARAKPPVTREPSDHSPMIALQEGLAELKRTVAKVIGESKRFGNHATQERASAEEWKRRAEMARRAGDEKLATEAETRRAEHERVAVPLEACHRVMMAVTDDAKLSLRELNVSLLAIKERSEMLAHAWEARLAEATAKIEHARAKAYLALHAAQHTS